MNSIGRKVYLLVAATLCAHLTAYSQTVITANDGGWENPATWVGGMAPTSANATAIIVNHDVLISGAVSASNVLVNASLTIATGAVLNIISDGLANPDLRVSGTLVCNDSSQLNGTSTLNSIFDAGAFYVHRQGPAGFVPMATWDPASTLQLSGFTTSGYINIAHSDGWKQTFGNVIYDCPAQTIFVVDLNGYLRNIAGSFTVRSTNNKTLRLSTTQNSTINVAGDFIVEGNSEVWFSTNSTACQINIGGSFINRSTSTGPSYLTTRGIVTLNIAGDFEMSSAGPIRMASSTPDSVGTRQATMLLGGNLSVSSGTLIAPPPGSGRGRIHFQAVGLQRVIASTTGTSFQGNMEYDIGPASTVDLGTSMISSDLGSLNVQGTIAVGSTHPGGAIQAGGQGNIHIPGPKNFAQASTIMYNGAGQQVIGNGHPMSADVNLICNNPSGTMLMVDLTVGDFMLQQGSFNASGHKVMIGGNVTLDPNATAVPSAVTLVGNKTQTLSCAGFTLNTLTIAKGSNSTVNLTSPLAIRDRLNILSSSTILNSFGHLRLLSESDDANGTAAVGSIPLGSAIEGDVTVERFMSGEGRIYRYMAASVSGASVASLMDDFPVTGTFQDPSTGSGINESVPSLFLYDESADGLLQGWKPFPTTGLSTAKLLEAGRGFCAYIREGSMPTLVDLTGRLNQGDVTIPLGFTPHGAPGNGWNLVGNPYASAVDWDAQGWTKENVSSVISIRDNGGGGIFHYWDGDPNSSDLTDGHIASGQSFWLRATAPNPRLIAREDVKVSAAAEFYRKRIEQIPSFGLILSRDSLVDRVFFKVRKGATDALDQWDAVKLPNDLLNISFVDHQGNSLAIDARGELPAEHENVDVLMLGLLPGGYHFNFVVNNELGNYRYVWLDHFLDTETILLPGKDYHIQVFQDLASQNTHRFTIRMERMSSGTTTDTASFDPQITEQGTPLSDSLGVDYAEQPLVGGPLQEIRLYPNPANSMLYIFCGQQTVDRISVLNSVGEDLGEFPANANPMSSAEREVDIARLPSGIYFAMVRTKTQLRVMRFEKYAF